MTCTLTDMTNTPDTNLLAERVDTWLATLTERHANRGSVLTATYTEDPLRKYVRIVMAYSGTDRSVHAFYDPKTGDVFKAAGWKAPAKHVRYNLLDDTSFTDMIGRADPFGSYLYVR